MPKSDHSDLNAMTAAAESAVGELEELHPGAWIPDDGRRGTPQPWAALERAAEEAVEDLEDHAIGELFPFVVVGVGTLSVLEFHCPDGWRADSLVKLYAQATGAGDDELAQAVRSETVLQRVRQAAGPQMHDRADPAERATDRFVSGIAKQLTSHAELGPAAVVLVETVPAMRERLATAARRCEAEAEARSRADLIEWFRKIRIPLPTTIGRELLTRQEIIERLEVGADPAFEDLARHWYDYHPEGGGRRRFGPIYA